MEFRKNNPGAVQFGNFINYYQFNSAEERLKLLPNNVWLDENKAEKQNIYLVLDVGCNSGDFTQILYKHLTDVIGIAKVFILGVDIDEKLIKRACEQNFFPKNIIYQNVDVMNETKFKSVVNNFMSQYNRQNFGKFDVVCCFSITMWIHLNHHDKGLKIFLTKLSSLADLFIVEPQPWKCYQTAERRLKKAGEQFPLFLQLQWRSNVEKEIQTYLEEVLRREKISVCDPTKWKRRICFYR